MEQKNYKSSQTKLQGHWIRIKGNVYACTNCELLWQISNGDTPSENEMCDFPKCGAGMSEVEEDANE